MTYDFDLFVIGGGSGGVRCARIAAGHGARVGVAEDRFWGGTCVNVGCVPKKILVQAAEYGAAIHDSRGFGWDVAAADHDWATLIANKDREISRLNGIYTKLLTSAGATIFDARASFIDAHTLDVGGKRVTADKIVVAVGGMPRRPEFPGAELGIVSDDAFYLPKRPKHVVILGGGYIAVEFAGIFRGLGAQVDLVFRGALPLRGFDMDLREALAEALTHQGITLHNNATMEKIEPGSDARKVTLSTGAVLAPDLVFFAVGREPKTGGLGLEAAGVTTSGFGAVVVNEQMETSVKNIFAIGDVTDMLNLTPVATAEGHILADRLFGNHARAWNFHQVPTAVFSSPPLATVGMTEDEAAMNGPIDVYVTRFTPMRHVLSGSGRRTVMKLIVDQQDGRILGAHMLGDDAPEIMQGIAIAMTAGATKAMVDQTIGIHPTAAEEFVTMRTRTRVAGVARAAE